MDKKQLLKAIDISGGQTKFARGLGLKQGQIARWVNRDKKAPPAEHVLKIEELTGVSRYDLRPDVFGEKPQES